MQRKADTETHRLDHDVRLFSLRLARRRRRDLRKHRIMAKCVRLEFCQEWSEVRSPGDHMSLPPSFRGATVPIEMLRYGAVDSELTKDAG
jgi:hypothetical protein